MFLSVRSIVTTGLLSHASQLRGTRLQSEGGNLEVQHATCDGPARTRLSMQQARVQTLSAQH